MMTKKIFFAIGVLALGCTSLSSCDRYLDIQPVGTVVPKTESDFRDLLTSAYQGFPSHKSLLSLRTDELVLDPFSTDAAALKDIYLWNDVNPDPATRVWPWVTFYKTIFYTNHVIAHIATAGSGAAIDQIKGEAYLLRAYAHFELLNSYAPVYRTETAQQKGIPLSTKIDLEQRFVPATIEEVYIQILADIDVAAGLLQVVDQKVPFRYRFGKRALLALQSRVHLYRSEWKPALDAATQALAINGDLEDLNTAGALIPSDYQSREMIMSLEETSESAVRNATTIAPALLAAYHPTEDMRFALYFQRRGSSYVSLKGGDKRYNVSFRNAELYLTAAECQLQLGDKGEALAQLDVLLKSRLSPVYYTQRMQELALLSVGELKVEIQQERRRELALEGLRWYDLRRADTPVLKHSYLGQEYVLQQGDPRYTIRYPKEALENNPDLNLP